MDELALFADDMNENYWCLKAIFIDNLFDRYKSIVIDLMPYLELCGKPDWGQGSNQTKM